MTRNDERVDLELTLHADPPSAAAILVSTDGDKENAVWLPRSQIEYDDTGCEGDIIMVTMPVWLATAKGLV